MRLFKNRGDIYIPKNGRSNSKEAKVLYILLIFIVLFTVVFIALLGHKYNSAAEFFGDGEVEISEKAENEEIVLPEISGKTNFLIAETDDNDERLHFIILLQADKSNKAYKATALPADLVLDGKSVNELYKEGGGALLQTRLTEYLSIEIDYYTVFNSASFVDFTNKLGSIIYPVSEDIKFSGGEEDDKYTIHLNEGEQKLSGREIDNLLRYYGEEKKDYFSQSELFLKGLTGLFNPENYEKSESLFRLFIKATKTDITVRDFENGKNSVYVFCMTNNDLTIYTVTAECEDSVLKPESAKEIKGYFSK